MQLSLQLPQSITGWLTTLVAFKETNHQGITVQQKIISLLVYY